MLSLKQLEALHWIVQLGTFERAAVKLNTTQSAISKRIQELEAATGLMVFDRSERGARLTDKGEELLLLGQQMLALSDQIIGLKAERAAPVRRLRLGVTELTSWTWLPRLVARLQDKYPSLVIEPEVEMSRTLYERLLEGTLDIIVMPEIFRDPDVTAVALAEVQNVWMARPGVIRSKGPMTLEQLTAYPVLTQGERSGSGMHFTKWLRSQGVSFPRMISSDSLNALLGMTVAGLGVSYVPECFRTLIDTGKLEKVRVTPALPSVSYAAMYRTDPHSAFVADVARLARSACDFSEPLQL